MTRSLFAASFGMLLLLSAKPAWAEDLAPGSEDDREVSVLERRAAEIRAQRIREREAFYGAGLSLAIVGAGCLFAVKMLAFQHLFHQMGHSRSVREDNGWTMLGLLGGGAGGLVLGLPLIVHAKGIRIAPVASGRP